MTPRIVSFHGWLLSLGLGAGLFAGQADLSAADWQSLRDNSPFGGASAPNTPPVDSLEFRGVVQEEGVCLVNLYDPVTRSARWIPVNSGVAGLEVIAYDAATDKVKIAQAGRPLTLALKQARVSLLTAPVAAAPAASPGNNEMVPDNADQAARLARIQELTRRQQKHGNGLGRGPNTTQEKDTEVRL